MGLAGLNAALSGLKIYQKQIETISSNVSNVGTEGYTRKILPQSAQTIEGVTVGVVGETVVRDVDLNLSRDLWTQVSSVGFYDVQQVYRERIDQFHGTPSAGISFAAELSKLQESFTALSDNPDDQFLQSDTVDQAQDTAHKINDLANYLTTLRNDAQIEATTIVQNINDLLVQIGELNTQIRFAVASGNTAAAMEDSRDNAIKELSSQMEISYFKRGDGVLVVQTAEGLELASDTSTQLYFNPSPLSATTYYPESAAGIYVGDPSVSANAPDITQQKIGGRLGGLITLRDQTFPQQTAQLDELAHKLALRFEAQGLRLFTDASGGIPADTPPDSSVDPPISVPYVGFSSLIQVNDLIVNDHSLIQKGTYGGTVATGSNEVIRRILEYTFTGVNYQTATNENLSTSVDLRANATGSTTLQDWLGLFSSNSVEGSADLSDYTSIASIIATGGTNVFGTVGSETDSFIIRFDDPDYGSGPYDIEIDLGDVAVSGSGAVQDLINHITADSDWANVVADFAANVSVGTNGEFVIESRGNIQIVNDPTEPLSDTGYEFLGLSESITEAKDPYFDISIGNSDPTRIFIEPNDTETELIAKLNAIDGIAAQLDTNGFLSIRPGGSFTAPDFGGDIKLVGGPFVTNSASLSGTAAGRTSLNNGVNIVAALFGTYQVLSGGAIQNNSPVIDVEYQSETENGSGVFVPFRTNLLGPGVNQDSEILGTLSIKDFANKIINHNSQALNLAESRLADDRTLQGLLEQELTDSSGVNLDEELGLLITVQTAYAASARVINAVNQLFQDLLDAV